MLFDVEQGKLVGALAAELKRQQVVTPPDWSHYAKTGHHRERPPVDSDWWYTRAASILRIVYLRGPVGTQKLRLHYGGRKNRGVAPDRFFPAAGNHLRKILQQLEAAKLVKQEEKGAHKGRVLTPLGIKFIHAVGGVVRAADVAVKAPKPASREAAPVAEAAPKQPVAETAPKQEVE